MSPIGEGAVALIALDHSRIPKDIVSESQAAEAEGVSAPSSKRGSGEHREVNYTSASDGGTIRVLVAYTSSAESYANNVSNIENEVDLLIYDTNQIFQRESLGTRLQLATIREVDYNENETTILSNRDHFQGTSDGEMDSIHVIRDNYAADIAVLLVNRPYGDPSGATWNGIANKAYAFAVVDIKYRSSYVFAHEIGHFFGGVHNYEMYNILTPPYPYSYGFWHADDNCEVYFTTVMSYSNPCTQCDRIYYYSYDDHYVSMGIQYSSSCPIPTGYKNYEIGSSTSSVREAIRLNTTKISGFYSGTGCGEICPVMISSDYETPFEAAALQVQNFPNPFYPETLIQYTLLVEAHVQIVVYDVVGRPVAVLLDGRQKSGDHTVRWDGRTAQGERLSSGIYLYRVQTDKAAATGVMTLLK